MTDPLGQFAGKRVFVTGHTGFKGSWLAIWLHRLGAHVCGYSLRPPTQPSNFEASRVQPLLAEHFEADIRNSDHLRAAMDRSRPEVIFHLAAQAIVRDGYVTPRETFDTNVMGTVNLLEGVRTLGRPCVVVVITSDKCYENREQLWGYRETDPMGGHDPYSASKGACELAASSYRRSFFDPAKLDQHGVKLATVRAGNVIGGGDWAKDRIVTDIVRTLSAGQAVPVRCPAAVRPWQHVLEPLSGYLLLASRLCQADGARWCGAWNFGPDWMENVPVSQLVEQFCQVWRGGRWQDVSDPRAPHEAYTLRLSIEKAVLELGWRPRWNVGEAVAKTAAWYRRFCQDPSASMLPACLEDIQAYQAAGAGGKQK